MRRRSGRTTAGSTSPARREPEPRPGALAAHRRARRAARPPRHGLARAARGRRARPGRGAARRRPADGLRRVAARPALSPSRPCAGGASRPATASGAASRPSRRAALRVRTSILSSPAAHRENRAMSTRGNVAPARRAAFDVLLRVAEEGAYDAGVPRDPGHRRARRADRRAGPAGRHVHAGTVQGLPDGRHAMVFATTDGRSRSSSSGPSPGRSRASRRRRCCSAACPALEDGYVANTWTLGRRARRADRGRARRLQHRQRRRHGHGAGGDRRRASSPCRAGRGRRCPPAALVTIPLTDPAVHRRASSSSARRRRCSSSARCRGSRRPGPQRVLGRPGRRAEPWTALLVAAAIVAVAVAVAVVARRAPARPADAAGRRRAGAARPGRLRPPRRAVARRRVHVGDVPHVRRRRPQGRRAGQRRRRRRRGRVRRRARTSTRATASTPCRSW